MGHCAVHHSNLTTASMPTAEPIHPDMSWPEHEQPEDQNEGDEHQQTTIARAISRRFTKPRVSSRS